MSTTPPRTLGEPRILVLDRTGDLGARLRRHAVGPGAVVTACADLTRAEAQLDGGTWDVLVAGPSVMHRGGLRRLAALHARHPEVAIVLAVHERPRADLAEIVQVGASDLVPLHAGDDELGQALQRAARITRRRLGLIADGSGRGRRGRIVMVASATGGSGKTFLATNAAEFLVRHTDRPVVLVDLDLQFGEVSTALRLRPETTIIDALAAEADGHDLDDVLDSFLLPHPDGFRVLAAPRHPAEADSVTPGDVTRILDGLRARGAWVVIDTHEGMDDLFRAALDAADHVLAVATPDRPSLVNLERYLGLLERLGLAPAHVEVVINKVEDGNGIPYSRDVTRSINVGVPLLVGKPKSPVSARLDKVFRAVLEGAPRVERSPAAVAKPAMPTPVPVPVTAGSAPAAAPVADPPEPGRRAAEPEDRPEADIAVVIDLRDPPPPAVPTGGEPTRIDLREPPAGRGRAPPHPFSPRLRRALVPGPTTK